MDTKSLIQHIETRFPGAVLQVQPMGRRHQGIVWLSVKGLQETLRFLKEAPETRLDWLENLSCFELDQDRVLTAFLRSTVHEQELVCRVAAAQCPPFSAIWDEAAEFEKEIAQRHGVVWN